MYTTNQQHSLVHETLSHQTDQYGEAELPFSLGKFSLLGSFLSFEGLLLKLYNSSLGAVLGASLDGQGEVWMGRGKSEWVGAILDD